VQARLASGMSEDWCGRVTREGWPNRIGGDGLARDQQLEADSKIVVDDVRFRCIIAPLCCNFPSVIRKARVACSLFFNRLQPIGVGAGVLGGLVLGE
jgi:hypothetical protein